ncbi:cytochrome P450 [Cladochytrium replicatum]|nr:cytochrome P450 [Cladochytrium replicatum]
MSSPNDMLFVLSLVAPLLIAVWHLFYQQPPDSLPGPYRTRLPILGNVLEVSYFAIVHSRADLFFDYVARRFGSFARVWFPAVGRGIVVTDAVAIRKILGGGSEGRMFARSEYVPVMAKDMTEYVMSTLPENTMIWKKHRKTISPAFSPSYLRRAHSIAHSACTKLMSKWLHRFPAVQADQISCVTVDSRDLLTIVLELTTRTMFSFDLNLIPADPNETMTPEARDFMSSIRWTVQFFVTRYAIPRPFWSLAGVGKADVDIRKAAIFRILDRAIDVKNYNKPSDETQLEARSRFDTSLDLLDRLLQAPAAENDEDPDGFTAEEVRGAQIGLLLGSLDTSFGTLQLALLELSSIPDLQARLASEIVDINTLSFGDNQSLRLHNAVIKETMRLNTIVPFVPRTAVRDLLHPEAFGLPRGTKIKKGDTAFLNFAGVHTSERYFSEPHKFDPERWLADDASSLPFFAFGDGATECVGKKQAMNTMVVVLAHIMARFIVSLGVKRDDVKIEYGSTLAISKLPLNLTLRRVLDE